MRRAPVLACLASGLSFAVIGCGDAFVETDGAPLHGDARLPPEEFADDTLQSALRTGGGVLYLNFEGESLSYGASFSKGRTTWLVPRTSATVQIPAFNPAHLDVSDRAEAIARIVELVQSDYRAYDLAVTTVRPTSGDYTMVIVGGKPSIIGERETTAGIAPLDRQDGNPNDIVFVFSDILYGLREIASCISHEGGHSYGLEHLKPLDDIMYPVLQRGTPKFQAGYTYDDNRFQDEPALLLAALGPRKAAPSPAAPVPAAETDDSEFVSQVVPSSVEPGASFAAQVTFRNAGTTTWTAAGGYALAANSATFGGTRVPLPEGSSVPPGASYTFGFLAKAPSEPGSHSFQWQLTKAGGSFGAPSAMLAVVVATGAGEPPVPPRGAFEALTSRSGRGWAFDSNLPAGAVRVTVYLDGKYIGYVTANRARADLVAAGKIPNAVHGFAFALPSTVVRGRHTIDVYGMDDSDGHAYKLGSRVFTK
jgi:hypothetical protein